MIIEKLYHTFIDTASININMKTSDSKNFQVTIKLIDFNGNPVLGEEVTVTVQGNITFSNNEQEISGNTDVNGEYIVTCTATNIGNNIIICNNETLPIRVFCDTDWKPVTFASGYGNYDSTHEVKYRAIDGITQISGLMKNNSAVTFSSNTIVLSIPEKFFYSHCGLQKQLTFAGFNQSNINKVAVGGWSGNVRLGWYGNTSNIQMPAGTCVPLHLCFIGGYKENVNS